LCFVFRDILGDQVFVSRRLTGGGYFLEGTLIPFKPPGIFTTFTTKFPSLSGGQLVLANVEPNGRSRNAQAYIAASGTMTVTRDQGQSISWYADLSLVAFENGPGPASAHLAGPFTCAVNYAVPHRSLASPTPAPPAQTPEEAPTPTVSFPTPLPWQQSQTNGRGLYRTDTFA
jgi:hypothetical protein